MQKYLLYLLIFLTPLIFWTITPNYYSTSKLFVLFTLGLLLIIAFAIQIIRSKSLTYVSTPLAPALISFLLAISANLIAVPEGRPEAIAEKGSLLIILPLLTLIFMISKNHQTLTKFIPLSLIITSAILSLHSLFQLTLLFNLSWIPPFMQVKNFTPTGSYLTTIVLILIGISLAIHKFQADGIKNKPLYLIPITIGTIASVAIISLMLPGSPLTPSLIPYKETWSITLDALKSFKSLIVGVGLSNYALLFSAVKPLSLNATNFWNIVPQTGTSELLTLFATTGILGGLSMIWIFIQGLRSSSKTELYWPILIITIALVLSPGTIVLYVIYFLLLSGTISTERNIITLPRNLALFIGSLTLILTIFGYNYVLRPMISEYYLARAQNAIRSNDGKLAYESHQQAIKYSPKIYLYHLSFSKVNLNLASALSKKQDLSDEEKTTTSQLIQQSINEGKVAASLRPNYSSSWVNLAVIYRNLINIAKGSDKFAIDNYAKAISLDPANPILRVEYAGLFAQLGQPDRARTELQTAIQLKSDYSNAYYNLAKVEESTNNYQNAYLAMQKTISLLGPDNSDLASATAELEALKSKLPKPSAIPSPSPSPTPLLSPSVDANITL